MKRFCSNGTLPPAKRQAISGIRPGGVTFKEHTFLSNRNLPFRELIWTTQPHNDFWNIVAKYHLKLRLLDQWNAGKLHILQCFNDPVPGFDDFYFSRQVVMEKPRTGMFSQWHSFIADVSDIKWFFNLNSEFSTLRASYKTASGETHSWTSTQVGHSQNEPFLWADAEGVYPPRTATAKPKNAWVIGIHEIKVPDLFRLYNLATLSQGRMWLLEINNDWANIYPVPDQNQADTVNVGYGYDSDYNAGPEAYRSIEITDSDTE